MPFVNAKEPDNKPCMECRYPADIEPFDPSLKDQFSLYIDENYATIPFPFKEIEAPSFSIKYTWNAAQLLGYLGTWSACKNFEKENAKNALDLISADVYKLWANRSVEITFPVLLRIGVHTH